MSGTDPIAAVAIAIADVQRTIAEDADFPVVAADLNGRVVLFNRAAERSFGYSAAEMLGRHLSVLHDLRELEAAARDVGLSAETLFTRKLRTLAEQGSFNNDWNFRTRDGSTFPARLNVAAVRNAAGELTGVVGMMFVLSAVRAAGEEAHRQRILHAAVERSVPVGIVATDTIGTITYVNPAFCRLVGYTVEEITSMPIPRPYWPPELSDLYRQAAARLFDKSLIPGPTEAQFIHRDGHRVDVMISVTPLLNDRGEQTGWLSSSIDIADRKKADRELYEIQERFRAAFHESAIGMAVLDRDGRFVAVNRAESEILGYSTDELLAMGYQQITHPDDLAGDESLARQLWNGQIASYQVEKRFLHKLGHAVWVHLTVAVVRDPVGLPIYYVGQIQDVTQRRQADAELRRAKEAAEAASQAKTAFLANISHEIRTPLTAVTGFAELLEQPNLSVDARLDFARTIRRNGEHLLAILNDILDLSKVEAGRLNIEPKPVLVRTFLHDLLAMMRERADQKGLQFYSVLDEHLPSRAVFDPTRVRQILINLLGNAIKFTDHGSVMLQAAMVSPTALRIDVTDTGIGIDPDLQGRVFEPFEQGDGSHSRRFGGVGLGLSISKRLATLLGGQLELTSTPGQGSTFTLHLPVTSADETSDAVETATQAKSELKPIRSGRVLIAEDSRDNQRLLEFLLMKMNQRVTVVGDGQAALDAVAASESAGRPIDLVIMDMQMPTLDGYAATPELRRRGYANPIIALTANVLGNERQRCLDLGCTDFLPKPLCTADLHRLLEIHLPADGA